MKKITMSIMVIILLSGFVCLFTNPGDTALADDQLNISIQIYMVSQQNLDGDQLPDVTIIDGAFASEKDQVRAYDQNRDMQTGNTWEQMTDFRDDVWVFDVGADGSAQLIIDFAKEGEKQAAYFYVDENQDGNVSYTLNGSEIQITESQYWRMKVVTNGDWKLPDGRINPDLKIYVDGTITRLQEWQMPLAANWANENLKTDGSMDWEIELGDQNGDGQADYAVSCLLKDIPTYYNAYPCNLYADENPRRSTPYSYPIFWPLLISTTNGEGGMYFDHPPAIVMDWENASIYQAGIQGYPAKQGYHILSTAPTWQKDMINEARWENPLAYYNLANDQNNWPELMIRVFQPWKDIYPINNLPKDNLEVEYNWDQNNDDKWDYVEIVAGRKTIDQQIDFPDFSVQTVPYEQLPDWVRGQTWDGAFFVVGEDGGRTDSESLWVWNNLSELQDNYLAGTSDAPALETFQDIPEGNRGEYIIDPNSQAKLYYSPVDHRLHQWQAQAGVWNLGGERRIRYQNLDGDGYIDQWQYWMGDTLVQQMNQANGSIIVSGMYQVKIKLTDTPASLFETQPPGNHDEWVKLGEQMQANQSELAGNDFTGMLEQLGGETLSIGSATLRDYRPTATGYRFVLGLEPGFTFEGPDWLGLASLTPGDYVVCYEDGNFSVQALTPAEISVSLEVDGVPTQFSSQNVGVRLANQGLEDAKQVLVALGTYQVGGEISWTEPQTVTVNAGESTLVSFDWSPKITGVWQMEAQASLVDPQSNNGQSVSAVQQVLIQPAEGSSLQEEVSGFGVVAPWQVVLLIGSVVLTAGLSGWALVRSIGQREINAVQDPSKVDRNKT
jgi:hypothetical protein